MSAQPLPYLTPEEYLEIERAAEYKSEYFEGVMWPLGGVPFGMAGGRYQHNLISGNVVRELGNALAGRGDVVSSDQRIGVSEHGLYTYADASVVCGEPDLHDDILANPCLIVEVLSKTTEMSDRGFKFTQYRRIPTFKEYLLVHQTEPQIEVFRRCENDDWTVTKYDGVDAVIPLENLGCSIRSAQVYLGVKF
jgi:Uma2 family endonuclease